MGRQRDRLTALQVKTAKDGWYNDGGNLHLRVANDGRSKKWVLRYARHGKVTEIGLGGADRVKLKLARELRDQYLETLAKGSDPGEEKRKARTAASSRQAFAKVAEEVIAARRLKWRASVNDGRTSSLNDWTRSLLSDCKPIANRHVGTITTGDIQPIVRPFWNRGCETTVRRLLNRMEAVFDYAKAMEWRTADNPATWALFKTILQATAPTGPKNHHPMLDWRDLPAFMAKLRSDEQSDTMAALALELMILTACRSGEVRGMLWDEIDFATATWTVPGERMKRKREHQVPLSDDAVALLRRLEPARINKFVFPGRSNTKPIGHWAVWELVRHLTDHKDGEPSAASPHGFRSSARSWMAANSVPHDVAEACLAHAVGNATSQAYNRERLLDLRRPIMHRWANFLSGADSNVVPLKQGAA